MQQYRPLLVRAIERLKDVGVNKAAAFDGPLLLMLLQQATDQPGGNGMEKRKALKEDIERLNKNVHNLAGSTM